MSNWMRGAAVGTTAVTVALTVVLAASTQAASLGPSTKVSVTPGSGGPRTHFTFHFRVPVATGTLGSVIRRDTLSVSGPRSPGACRARRRRCAGRGRARGRGSSSDLAR